MILTQYLIQCLSSWQVEPDGTCKKTDHGGDGIQKHGPESIFHDGNPLEAKDEYEPGCCQSQGDETNVDLRDILDEDASVGSGSEFFGFGFAIWAKFGFGFDRVCKFQQSSGSGLSGFIFELRVLGFIGFGFEIDYQVSLKLQIIQCILIDWSKNTTRYPKAI